MYNYSIPQRKKQSQFGLYATNCYKGSFAIGDVTPTSFGFRIIVVLAHTKSAVYYNGAPNVTLY